MMGIYMMIANVLLLNLLIAMFSNTFRKVQDNTDKHWHFQRYSLINEYYNRPVLFPPLILLAHIYLLFGFICESCCCKVMKKQRRKFKNERELIKWENVIAHAFHRKRELEDVADLEHKVDSTHNIIEEIQQQLEVKIPPRLDSRLTHIEEIQQQLEVKISSRLDNRLTNIEEIQQQLEVKIPPRLDSRLTNIEEILQQLKVKIEPRLDRRLNIIEKQLESTQKSLEWIISTLQNNSVKENKPAEPAQERYEDDILKFFSQRLSVIRASVLVLYPVEKKHKQSAVENKISSLPKERFRRRSKSHFLHFSKSKNACVKKL
ncbi:TRPM1-like protein [Mya arenaria]|uniref:TRPM1-like protein n=1 Tax=Mya arenaria TaxID=6604 RepID=A0ABY7E887_MYAAR|nr:TRPM1-like protein [Mya arenaria]